MAGIYTSRKWRLEAKNGIARCAGKHEARSTKAEIRNKHESGKEEMTENATSPF
jgi:hypothetical protein